MRLEQSKEDERADGLRPSARARAAQASVQLCTHVRSGLRVLQLSGCRQIPDLQNFHSHSVIKKPYAHAASAAAIKLLCFICYGKNNAWPVDRHASGWADAQVLQAASKILAGANALTIQKLTEYLG